MNDSPNMKMRCAVIGSQGFIGRHLEYYLKKLGHDVKSYDLNGDNCQRVDMTDKQSAQQLDLSVDYVFMFAGLTGTYSGFDAYEKFIYTNELSLLNLLDAIRQSAFRPKVVFPSTRLVYKGCDKPLKEEDEKDSKTVYAVNKLACEGYLRAYSDSFDIPYTIFRICVPYGNLLSADYSYGTVGSFIKQAKIGKVISLYGGGTVKRTFTHMEDLCYQVTHGAFHPDSTGNIYNIGGESLSLHDAAMIIARKYGATLTTVPWPKIDLRIESGHTYFDDSKIRTLLKRESNKRLEDFVNDL